MSPTPPRPLADAHVAVVGAGISGLAAAERLGRAGVRVTVLESSERVGGKRRRAPWRGRRWTRRRGGCRAQARGTRPRAALRARGQGGAPGVRCVRLVRPCPASTPQRDDHGDPRGPGGAGRVRGAAPSRTAAGPARPRPAVHRADGDVALVRTSLPGWAAASSTASSAAARRGVCRARRSDLVRGGPARPLRPRGRRLIRCSRWRRTCRPTWT